MIRAIWTHVHFRLMPLPLSASPTAPLSTVSAAATEPAINARALPTTGTAASSVAIPPVRPAPTVVPAAIFCVVAWSNTILTPHQRVLAAIAAAPRLTVSTGTVSAWAASSWSALTTHPVVRDIPADCRVAPFLHQLLVNRENRRIILLPIRHSVLLSGSVSALCWGWA